MTDYTTYPLSHGNRDPGGGFVKMEMGRNLEGTPEGFHTGGPWLSPNKEEVWKPLDARPHRGADCRMSTDEAVCLEEMAGTPGFPRNWRIETRNERRWLVRGFSWLWPQKTELGRANQNDVVRLVENAVYDLNAHGWEAFGSDVPQAALDPDGNWFLLDLSAAHKPSKWQSDWHGDRERVIKWLGLVGYDHLANLRRRGRNVVHNISLSAIIPRDDEEPYRANDVFYDVEHDDRKTFVYVYASLNRPMSSVWARMDGVRYLMADISKSPRVHTWAVANRELSADEISRFELTPAYSPWP